MASAERDLDISPAGQNKLSHLADLLHLFHHRNKTQHRHSIWYRHFSLFRKQLNHLVSSISSLNSTPTTNLARTQKKRTDAKIVSDHTQRMEFWRDVMVPRWQYGFSQLVADGRFAVLGVVLMACLAEVCQVVGIVAELEDLAEVQVRKVLEEFGREEWSEGGAMREDHGEVVKRVEEEDEPARPDESVPKPREETKDTAKSSKKRSADGSDKKASKKRKKTGNAIDDIFG